MTPGDRPQHGAAPPGGRFAARGPDPAEVGRVAAELGHAITTGAIPPFCGLQYAAIARQHATTLVTARSALALLRRAGLAIYHPPGPVSYYYAAPAGPPDPAITARLGRIVTTARTATGLSITGLATRITDAHGPYSAHGRQHVISLRKGEITAIENGTWHPRYTWAWIDAALPAHGTLLAIHDRLYTNQHHHSQPP